MYNIHTIKYVLILKEYILMKEFEMDEGDEDDLFDNNGQDLIDKNLQDGAIKYGDDDGDEDDQVQSDQGEDPDPDQDS